MITQDGLYYTLEELKELTGLATSTIYNLTQDGIVLPPVRGMVKGNPGKGLYKPETLDRIRKYIKLRMDGLSAKAAKEKIVGSSTSMLSTVTA